MTLCDGDKAIPVCERCQRYVQRPENYCAAERTTTRARPMILNGRCVDFLRVPVNGSHAAKEDLL